MEVLPYWPNYAAEWSIYNASNAKRILKNPYINQIAYTLCGNIDIFLPNDDTSIIWFTQNPYTASMLTRAIY